jgi:glucan phosphorylase
MSLIDEGGERYVRMAYLATVGSHAINGVAELHTKLLQETTLRDFFDPINSSTSPTALPHADSSLGATLDSPTL